MLDDLRMLNSIGRRFGKTTALCKAAKEINALVLCPFAVEARRVAREHGVRTAHLGQYMAGQKGPVLVDTYTVEVIARSLSSGPPG